MRRPRLSMPVLIYLIVALAVGMLGLLLARQSEASQQNRAVLIELQEQNDIIRGLLERQNEDAATRQALIDEAVAAIAAEQYRALVAHDRRTEEALNRALGLLDREVNSPANKEQPRVVIPAPQPPPTRAPFVGPRPPRPARTAAPAPQPAPAPRPSPCEQRGKSGKCRK